MQQSYSVILIDNMSPIAKDSKNHQFLEDQQRGDL